MEKSQLPLLLCAFILALWAYSCQPGVPIYDNNGKYDVRFVQDTVSCELGERFFFLIDGALLTDESLALPYVLFIDEGEHVLEVACVPTLREGWVDTVTIVSDTTLVVTCPDYCR